MVSQLAGSRGASRGGVAAGACIARVGDGMVDGKS